MLVSYGIVRRVEQFSVTCNCNEEAGYKRDAPRAEANESRYAQLLRADSEKFQSNGVKDARILILAYLSYYMYRRVGNDLPVNAIVPVCF